MKTNVIHSIDKHVDEVMMALFLTGVITMMSVHVFFRYVLKSPLTWTEECTRYCFIWFVYSGIGYGVRNATHIRINILEIFFPKIVPAFSLIQTVITTAFFAYLIVPSIEVVVQTVQRNQFSPGMHLPMGCVYISVTLGLILGVIRGIQVLIDWIRTYILKRPATETVEGGVLK